MSHLPWLPLYVDRFLSSARVRRMDALEFGIFMSLLIEEWKAGGPLDPEDVLFLSRGEKWATDVERILQTCFKQNDQGWYNETLEEIRLEQLHRHQVAVESGRRGGIASAKQRSSNP